MKNLKKVLALVVVFAMMLSTVAFAGTFADVADDAYYAGAVETLAALGYFLGDDNGNFNPDATITRAEYATIICRLLGIADSATGTADFADVDAKHWATSYIKMANQYGIVAGYGDGNFGPEDPVKYEEAIKMLVCALGYEPMAISKGGWSTGYVATASQIGLLDGILDAAEGAGAARKIVAMMTYNALDLPVMEQVGFGTEIKYEIMHPDYDNAKSTILTKAGIYALDAVVVANSKVSYDAEVEATDKGYVTLEMVDVNNCPVKPFKDLKVEDTYTFEVGETNAEDLVAHRVIAYVAKSVAGRWKLVAIESDDDSVKTLSIKASSLNDTYKDFTGTTIRYYKEGVTSGTGTLVRLDASKTLTWNNVKLTATDTEHGHDDLIASIDSSLEAEIEFIDWDNDNDYDVVNVKEYKHLIAKEVDAEEGIIETYNGDYIELDIENEDAKYTIKDVKGNDVALDKIEDGDVLAVIITGDTTEPSVDTDSLGYIEYYTAVDVVVLKDSTVTGKVMEDDGNGTIKVDKEYDVDASAYNYSKIELNSEGTFYIGINGTIVGFEGDKVASENYGFIMSGSAPVGKNYDAYLEILGKDGTIKNYPIANKLTIKNPDPEVDELEKDTKAVLTEADLAVFAETTWAFEAPTGDDATATNDSGELTNSFRRVLTNMFAEIEDITYNAAAAKQRLVTYKLNSNGEIKEITPASTASADSSVVDLGFAEISDKEYDVDGQRLTGQNFLSDDVIVFYINEKDASASKIYDLGYFVDENKYSALLYNRDENGQYGVAVITGTESVFGATTNLAIVKSKATVIGDDEETTLIKLVAVKDGKDVELTINTEDVSANDSTDSVATYDVGTIFEYVANDAGEIIEYRTIGHTTVTSGARTFTIDTDIDNRDKEDGVYVDEYYYGYIAGNLDNKNTVTLNITANGQNEEISGEETYTVMNANKYTLTGNNKKNTSIYFGSWTRGIKAAKLDKDGNTVGYYALIKIHDGDVVDIVAFGDNEHVLVPAE